MPYVGRFAPSPTGPLHLGSLVAALASWLDARAHGGRWLVRIEDIDTPRCVPGAPEQVLAQLAALRLSPDETPLRQSDRTRGYEAALNTLIAQAWAYPCGCTRAEIERVWSARGRSRTRHGETAYPGTCRHGLQGKQARASRVVVAPALVRPSAPLVVDWHDRRLGAQRQDVSAQVGDFVLRRADGLWAYQLAVVVDDARQGITHVVRGEDLADNTPRQIHLQRLLGLAMPSYLHAPLVRSADGEKLSKQNGAEALDLSDPVRTLRLAGERLGFRNDATGTADWLASAVSAWRSRWARD